MTYMSTYSNDGNDSFVGSSVRRDLYLCPGGSFLYAEEGSVSVDSAGTSGFDGSGDDGSGQWRVIEEGGQIGLELTWQNGQVSAHLLQYEGGATYVDQERWFVTDDNPYC